MNRGLGTSKSFRVVALPVVLGMLVLSSCAKYKPKTLHTSIGKAQTKQGVTLSAHAFTEQDCRYYFSRRMLSKGYQPIQLSFKNNSNKTYVLDTRDISVSLERVHRVAKDCHLNTAGRVASWGVASLFLWPFLIPTVVDGVKASKANKKLDRDFERRALDVGSKIHIYPQESVHKIMFVDQQNYRQKFDVILRSEENSLDSIKFNVNLISS